MRDDKGNEWGKSPSETIGKSVDPATDGDLYVPPPGFENRKARRARKAAQRRATWKALKKATTQEQRTQLLADFLNERTQR